MLPASMNRTWCRSLPPVFLFLIIFPTGINAQEVVDTWKYTFSRPAAPDWYSPDFDATGWKEGQGGFGTHGTPGSRVSTEWSTKDIFLRKEFPLAALPTKPAIMLHHDEDVKVYLNGQLVYEKIGFTQGYQVVPLGEEGTSNLKTGENALAVSCHQTTGGQFIDAHVIDAEDIPKLPESEASTKLVNSKLITVWGEKVTPENAWDAYPRPQLRRKNWTSLNGNWDYAISPRESREVPNQWDGKILVPFALESKLSGVQRLLLETEALWYRRTLAIGDSPDHGTRKLLNFEAVDYRCEVFVNGKSVGKHVGGNTPFSFDITAATTPGENELVVRVEDDTEEWQLRGKQSRHPRGIWYSRVSGIWQSVWLEEVPAAYIQDVKITTDASKGAITIRPLVGGADIEATDFSVTVRDGDRVVAEHASPGSSITLTIPDAKLWAPTSPHLYDIELVCGDDKITTYAGIRTVGKIRDKAGHLRFTLNDREIFHWGPLDQGWWPDGLLTPPSDEAMLSDIEFLRAAGFNMIRKHIKVEPRRYYYHCDRLGMLVWQDHVSAGKGPAWTKLEPNPVDREWPAEQHVQFMAELEGMVSTLENHPSIVVWVPFNEAWGQHQTVSVGQWLAKRDPTRHVNIASGGNFWPIGDIADKHHYPHPTFPFAPRFNDYIKVVGEFGGHGYPVSGHLWNPDKPSWGYGNFPKSVDELWGRYKASIQHLNQMKSMGVAAGVYTQTTDVEGEINGLLTYDRRVKKFEAAKLAKLHEGLTIAPAADPVERHDRAFRAIEDWMRDPFVFDGNDGFFYLTHTTNADNIPLWRSKDLINWERLPDIWNYVDSWLSRVELRSDQLENGVDIWAPEIHRVGDRWVIMHTTNVQRSNVMINNSTKLEGPFTEPLKARFGHRHDPTLFIDDDGAHWLVNKCTELIKIKPDMSGFLGEPIQIGPSGEYRLGHEGVQIMKFGKKYVLFGTAWSTNQFRKGTYNLYYCTADKITGPYSERKFVGRYCGHGTVFQDRSGKWWVTAFKNGPLVAPGSEVTKDAAPDGPHTINSGMMLVPLEVAFDSHGEPQIRAIDPHYRNPGPEEDQSFDVP